MLLPKDETSSTQGKNLHEMMLLHATQKKKKTFHLSFHCESYDVYGPENLRSDCKKSSKIHDLK